MRIGNVRMRCAAAAALALGLLCGTTSAQAAYHLVKKVAIGGEGGWDILRVDPEARRLYISRSNRVLVVDTDSCKVVAEIPNTPGVHDVAIAHDLGRGYTSNGADTSSTIFDLKDYHVLGRVKTGIRPDAMAYDPATKRVFVMNGGSRDATAIDAATGKAAGTVALGGRPEYGVADGKGRLYVNLEDSSAVVVVDTKTLAPIARWPLAPGQEPSGIALDVEHRRIFSTCGGNQLMVVMDASTGHVLTSVPIGKGVDAACFDPATGLAFSSNGADGNLTVVHEDAPNHFVVRETVPTQLGARTMALDEKSHRIFLVSAEFGPPPAPTPAQPRPRRTIVPGSFVLLVLGE